MCQKWLARDGGGHDGDYVNYEEGRATLIQLVSDESFSEFRPGDVLAG